jgi:hypothetical protein
MMHNWVPVLASIFFLIAVCCRADSIETQDNPVTNGTITVADGNTDRSDWDGIPWFETDEDFDEFSPVDIDRVQIAHDSTNLYLHLTTLNWDVNESWRVGLYINTDESNETGYNGSFLAVGADVLVEGAAVYTFSGASQAEWAWTQAGDLMRDQTEMTDVEVAIPRQVLDNPSVIDFILFANNFCCDFGLPDDVYPNGGANVLGDYFSYELSTVILPGDFDGNGALDAVDIDDLTGVSAGTAWPSTYDLNSDALVDEGDVRVWIKDLFNSWVGDANLDGEFNSSDLVTVLATGTYEADVAAVWTTGDFNGDGRADSSDLVAALADGGYELGPRAAIRAVPEPTGALLLSLGILGLLTRRPPL